MIAWLSGQLQRRRGDARVRQQRSQLRNRLAAIRDEQCAAFPHAAEVHAEARLQFTGTADAAFHVVSVSTSEYFVK